MEVDPLNQYRELCADCRNREGSAWLIPGGAFTWTALTWGVISQANDPSIRVLLAFLNALVFSSQIHLFVRWSLYQTQAQRNLAELLKRPEFSAFVQNIQYMGLMVDEDERKNLPIPSLAARFLANRSSTRYLVHVMMLILALDVGLLIWLLISGWT